MKLIIAGSRSIDKYRAFYQFILWRKLHPHITITEFVTGECPDGADQIPWLLRRIHDHEYADITSFPAEWDLYGKSAGPRRNRRMAEYADALLLIWDNQSRGSANMKREMKRYPEKMIWEIICST